MKYYENENNYNGGRAMKYEYIAVALAIFVMSLLYGLVFGVAIAKDVSTDGAQQRNVEIQMEVLDE